MYLTIEQVTLIADPRKLTPDDPIIYERELTRGERIFTLDGGGSLYATPARRYGRFYYDSRDDPCIVPDAWDETDASQARLARGPEEFAS